MRILLVEDDTSLAEGVCTALRHADYTVDWIADGVNAYHAIQNEVFDLVVLDLGLPSMDGISVLRGVRDKGVSVPILLLTARDAIEERIQGLDAGADDYLTKPFDLSELQARIRALVRRASGRASEEIIFGDLSIDTGSRAVCYQGQPVTLTRREYSLLMELLSRPGHVFTRDVLTQVLYGWDEDVESNALEVHVHHLRKKLGSELIRTVRGVGYVINKALA
ncbi:response regulator [Maribrevibacterium harenarium]|uniref:Response regulator n=1 Tax=Maribrevibacterium harenarium TaxID=2589817 RepID=A0A501W5M0_9GAMM|nr:response regulator [Maribrevibacterium harenarium]TPE44568.1 response regulator [Maribrevibacterium harenarium]